MICKSADPEEGLLPKKKIKAPKKIMMPTQKLLNRQKTSQLTTIIQKTDLCLNCSKIYSHQKTFIN
jgi:uncharacterized membrane protein